MQTDTPVQTLAVVPKRTVVLSVETAPLKMKKVISSDGDIDERAKQLKSRSAIYRMMRNKAYAKVKGKDYKINPIEKTKAIARLGYNISLVRKLVLTSWGPKAQIYDNKSTLEEAWKNHVDGFSTTLNLGEGKTLPITNDMVKTAFGRDAHGEAKRAALEAQKFQRTGGGGKFRPYYVGGGVMRGGYTGKGRDSGNAFMIPIQPKNEERILQSVQAKYTNPTSWPSTRIIKYVRGHWGVNPGKNGVNNDLVYF